MPAFVVDISFSKDGKRTLLVSLPRGLYALLLAARPMRINIGFGVKPTREQLEALAEADETENRPVVVWDGFTLQIYLTDGRMYQIKASLDDDVRQHLVGLGASKKDIAKFMRSVDYMMGMEISRNPARMGWDPL